MNVVEVSDVRFSWRKAAAFALDIPKFTIAAGEKVLLLGPSGSGKSTFLSLIAGILEPQAGRIVVRGTEISKLSPAARDRFRAAEIGIIFQMFNLLPYLSCLDNVVLALAFGPERRRRAEAAGPAADEARRLLSRLGIDPAVYADKSAVELSVGQQQRVAAARALIGRPGLVIADEPTSSLDRNAQEAFLALLLEEIAAADAALLMVSHDQSFASRFDRVVALDAILRQSTVGAPL
ncbi:MAG: ABC transporter ATP-binding protein [Bauldia sp.]